jgi:hypothetical protein
LGEDEVARGVAALKPLRGAGEQIEIKLDELEGRVAAALASVSTSGS